MRSKVMIAAVVGAIVMFGVLGYLSWETKYGRGRTVDAVAAIDTIVVHQRVMGHGVRGPVAQDRLVAIDGRTGDERTRITVLRGELYLETAAGNGRARASRLTKSDHSYQWTTELPWQGHDTKLVVQLGGNVVIVDADGIAAVDRTRGDLAWVR